MSLAARENTAEFELFLCCALTENTVEFELLLCFALTATGCSYGWGRHAEERRF